jgi:hypothetical protein
MENPCCGCEIHKMRLNKLYNPTCIECKDRLVYVAALGGMTHSVPDALCDYRRFTGKDKGVELGT